MGNPIFLSIDVKLNCAGDGETNHISEIGIAVLDTRVLIPRTTSANQAPDMLSPGPRGQNWCKAINSRHLRVKQNFHHDTRCNYRNSERHKGDAAGFLFRSSKLLDARNCHRYLNDFKKNMINRNLYTGEKERKIIMITWTSTMEIDKLKNLNTKWFEEVDGCWEVQKMAAAQRLAIKYTNGKSLSLEIFCTALGLPFQSSWYHNAGNDATFALVSTIAGLFLTPAEHATLGNRSLPVLDNWWSTQSFAGTQAQNQANEQEYLTMSRKVQGQDRLP